MSEEKKVYVSRVGEVLTVNGARLVVSRTCAEERSERRALIALEAGEHGVEVPMSFSDLTALIGHLSTAAAMLDEEG